jgi:uncharacterized membrane protein
VIRPAKLPLAAARLRNRVAREEGSTLILTSFFCALALVVILLVVAATSLYLERKQLFTLADGASLAGAEAFGLDRVTVSDAGTIAPQLSSADVAAAVDDYLSAQDLGRFDGLTVTRAGSVDGRSATVSLAATWHPPILSLLVPDGIGIEVTSVARSVFG